LEMPRSPSGSVSKFRFQGRDAKQPFGRLLLEKAQAVTAIKMAFAVRIGTNMIPRTDIQGRPVMARTAIILTVVLLSGCIASDAGLRPEYANVVGRKAHTTERLTVWGSWFPPTTEINSVNGSYLILQRP
jgi:hypothetical protein